jgi:hypothetical protein
MNVSFRVGRRRRDPCCSFLFHVLVNPGPERTHLGFKATSGAICQKQANRWILDFDQMI